MMIAEDHPGLLDVEQAAELHQAFEAVDIDAGGALGVRDMGELVDTLVEMQAASSQGGGAGEPEGGSFILSGVRAPTDMEVYEMMSAADPAGKGSMTFPYFAAAVAAFVKTVKRELGTAPPSPEKTTRRAREEDNDDDEYGDDGFDDDDDGSMEEDFEIAVEDEDEDFLGN